MQNVYTSGSFTLTVDFDPNSTVYNVTPASSDVYIHKLSQCKSSINIITANACNSYILNNITYDSTGVYYQTIKNSTACDSIIQLNLTVTKVNSKITVSECNALFMEWKIINQQWYL